VAWTAVASFGSGLADPGVDAAQVLGERHSELARPPCWPYRRQKPGSMSWGGLLRDTAGDQPK